MELSSVRTLDVPIDRAWKLQLAHHHWAEHIPHFDTVQRVDGAGPPEFGIGSKALITQKGLGTVEWTVVRFDDSPEDRNYAWTGAVRGMRFEGRHRVTAIDADHTTMTLGITGSGWVLTLLGPLLRGTMRKALDAEADAFQRWATA
jgi:hypothetical protein